VNTRAITFEMLQDKFIAGLPRRIARLRDDFEVISDSRRDASSVAAALEDLHLAFHSLAGTAGTYGFTLITELSAIGERLTETLRFPVGAYGISMLDFVIDSIASLAPSPYAMPAPFESEQKAAHAM
jgi:chemotaxis protein histidine kinase CheA